MSESERLRVSEYLHTLSPNVYFQPSESTTLKYPCIIYEPNDILRMDADNLGYIMHTSYQCTVITSDKTSDIPEKLLAGWQQSDWSTYFVTDNLYHTVLILYI